MTISFQQLDWESESGRTFGIILKSREIFDGETRQGRSWTWYWITSNGKTSNEINLRELTSHEMTSNEIPYFLGNNFENNIFD